MMGYYSVGVIDNVHVNIKGREIGIQFKADPNYSMIGPEQKEYNLFVNSSGEKLDICPLEKSKELRVFNSCDSLSEKCEKKQKSNSSDGDSGKYIELREFISCDNLMEIFYKLYKNKQLIQIHINDENEVVEWKTVNG